MFFKPRVYGPVPIAMATCSSFASLQKLLETEVERAKKKPTQIGFDARN